MKKRVCFVFYDLSALGGAEQVGVNVANDMASCHEIYLYSICKTGKEIPYRIESNISVEEAVEETTRIRQLTTKNFRHFLQYIKKNRIDIVLEIGNYAAAIISFTRLFTKAKYIFCDHGALMNQWNEKDITMIRWIASKFCHKMVVLTDKTRSDYIEHFHISPRKIVRIYNWISKDLIEKSQYSYDTKSKKILSVGRFGPEKGYDLLVQVAEKILPKHPEWEWDIIGDGEEFEKIKCLVSEKGLENQVILKGRVNDASNLFHKYALFVLTSYREGLPLVLLEAKINHLPMVSFDIQTGPDEIIDKENGVLIPPYDCDRMAKAIEKIITDDSYRYILSKGTDNNIEKFSYSVIHRQWVQLLEEL